MEGKERKKEFVLLKAEEIPFMCTPFFTSHIKFKFQIYINIWKAVSTDLQLLLCPVTAVFL